MTFADIVFPEDVLPMQDPMSGFYDHLRKLAMGCLAKEVHELTEDEKFAIAFYAGVRMTSDMEEGTNKMRFRTEPIGIIKVDGKFIVACHTKPK